MANTQFLTPVLVLISWTVVMWFALYMTRIPAMKAARIHPNKARNHDSDWKQKLPARVRSVAENYNHLHEQPTLFYALMLFIALTVGGSSAAWLLAWGYVICRVIHSLIQVSSAPVVARFFSFLVASVLLIALLTHTWWRLFTTS
ncbi:MAG: MAPEG family protein [Pseudomonadota bacterium]